MRAARRYRERRTGFRRGELHGIIPVDRDQDSVGTWSLATMTTRRESSGTSTWHENGVSFVQAEPPLVVESTNILSAGPP